MVWKQYNPCDISISCMMTYIRNMISLSLYKWVLHTLYECHWCLVDIKGRVYDIEFHHAIFDLLYPPGHYTSISSLQIHLHTLPLNVYVNVDKTFLWLLLWQCLQQNLQVPEWPKRSQTKLLRAILSSPYLPNLVGLNPDMQRDPIFTHQIRYCYWN